MLSVPTDEVETSTAAEFATEMVPALVTVQLPDDQVTVVLVLVDKGEPAQSACAINGSMPVIALATASARAFFFGCKFE
ncbi:hypothetical protein [Pararobbsia silviterrae]|uniref:hypothetical protein n=1 Tax=Pararobbsia silviterrae TaxID=1792498 RepID=UPI001315016B|nr:hypothetical protein [Pararobbsia silviterrae]